MKKPNITPSPWAANVDTVWTARSSHLMTCFPLHDEQSRANAQAIAALPELLAALESCLLRLDNHDEQSAPECLQARAALTKAGYTF